MHICANRSPLILDVLLSDLHCELVRLISSGRCTTHNLRNLQAALILRVLIHQFNGQSLILHDRLLAGRRAVTRQRVVRDQRACVGLF